MPAMRERRTDLRPGFAPPLMRAAVRTMKAYVPGTSLEEVQRRFGLERIVKLASNENPLGSSPKAMAALTRADRLNVYFDDAHTALRERLGASYGLGAKNVVLGHGSNELVAIACQTFLEPGDEAVMAAPSFTLYKIAVLLHGATPVEVPLREDAIHDLEAMLEAITPRTKMIFVCDPNNPTATALPVRDWRSFLERLPAEIALVVDQAYLEYAGSAAYDAAPLAGERPNTLVLRTMSKIYGLASLRFGYGFGDAETIEWMNRVRLPFNVSRPAALGAWAALDDSAFVQQSIASNEAGKAFVFAALERLGLHAYPSHANFYAVRVPVSATLAYEALLERGIIVRSGDALGMPGRLRVTVGSPEQNAFFVDALAELLKTW